MNLKVAAYVVPAFVLAANLLQGATPQQARITIVEHNAAPGASASAQPSVVRKQVPGEPDREAYQFSQIVRVGSPVTEVIPIAFHQPTTLKSIEASNDFGVASSSCQIGRTYNEGESCVVSVTLDPKGPGKRSGQLAFTSNESATPDVVGLQGQTMGAVLSFIPAQINTVPQTLPSGKPLFSQATGIAIDQGDNLYVVDAQGSSSSGGSGLVYFMDSSQKMIPLLGGGATHVPANGSAVTNANVFLNAPWGIAVDSFLDLYTTELHGGLDMTSRGNTWSIAGLGGSNAWGCSTPCTALNTAFFYPSSVNVDDQQNIFVTDDSGFYSMPWVSNGKYQLSVLNHGSLGFGGAFGLDSTDNLYALENTAGQCMIDGITPGTKFQWDTAGSGICGFAGNNVRSQNAEIQNNIGQYAFDAAGDMYFTDTTNNVIRRVDAYNGLIRTVAGVNAAGNTGDGGTATLAALSGPMGIGVDSMGDVYTTQIVPVNSVNFDDVRMVGPVGYQTFPWMLVGKTSPVETVLLTNTGNDELMVSNEILGGSNPGDFIVDPATTSCVWSQGLTSGRSCQLGFSCKPTAAGKRTATITFVDNTAAFQNTLDLNCNALSAPVATTVVVAPPTNNSIYIAGSNIDPIAWVNNTLNPFTPPTGTVNMTITNTVSNTTVATFNGLTLVPENGISRSNTHTQVFQHAPVGKYSITASYAGDAIDAPANATPVAFSVVQVTPTVTITAPANNSQYLPGFMTATVQVSNAGLTPTAPSPTGTLAVVLTNTVTNVKSTFNTNMPAGSNGVTLTNIQMGSLAVGTYSLTASYSGDTADTAAIATPVNFSVVQLTPQVTITSPQATGYFYETLLTYSASVSNAGLTPADASAPTGTVTFTVTNLTTSAISTYGPFSLGAGFNNVVNISVPFNLEPTVASYQIVASYSGDTDDAAASSNPLLFNVNPVTPAIVWPTPAAVYQGTQLSSTQLDAVAKYNGFTVPGNYAYNPPAGTVENTSGQVTLKVTFTPTDSTDFNSAQGSVQLTVLQTISVAPPTVTTLSSTANPTQSGKPVGLTAHVKPVSGDTMPTGTVLFTEGEVTVARANLSNGSATVTLPPLQPGMHTLVARYLGDAHDAGSSSQPVSQSVIGSQPNSPDNPDSPGTRK